MCKKRKQLSDSNPDEMNSGTFVRNDGTGWEASPLEIVRVEELAYYLPQTFIRIITSDKTRVCQVTLESDEMKMRNGGLDVLVFANTDDYQATNNMSYIDVYSVLDLPWRFASGFHETGIVCEVRYCKTLKELRRAMQNKCHDRFWKGIS
ncbi:hypothetical protein TNCV_3582331 [Trichonephila clavipes]|nr:hypothetical protein TNCV_3582331 [Trichonephila clavipes]